MPANQDQGCYQQAASVRFSDANSVPKKLHGSVFDAKFAPHKCTDRPRYFYPAVCQLSQVRHACAARANGYLLTSGSRKSQPERSRLPQRALKGETDEGAFEWLGNWHHPGSSVRT
jgi:hypothetical protein